ncbi:hypothetical protein [Roseimaritima sediminicola]|uniref:hypothetical protein n=1 Tax=Roseimaritima sediminicola TaxID=2662066 RepID=UPI00129848DE|nr:hypothetical protein [Roseimaritima sediminicola]
MHFHLENTPSKNEQTLPVAALDERVSPTRMSIEANLKQPREPTIPLEAAIAIMGLPARQVQQLREHFFLPWGN